MVLKEFVLHQNRVNGAVLSWPAGDFCLAGFRFYDGAFDDDVSSDEVSVGGGFNHAFDGTLDVLFVFGVVDVRRFGFHDFHLECAAFGFDGFDFVLADFGECRKAAGLVKLLADCILVSTAGCFSPPSSLVVDCHGACLLGLI